MPKAGCSCEKCQIKRPKPIPAPLPKGCPRGCKCVKCVPIVYKKRSSKDDSECSSHDHCRKGIRKHRKKTHVGPIEYRKECRIVAIQRKSRSWSMSWDESGKKCIPPLGKGEKY